MSIFRKLGWFSSGKETLFNWDFLPIRSGLGGDHH